MGDLFTNALEVGVGGRWWPEPVPGVVAVFAGGDHVAGFIPAAVTPRLQMFCGATQAAGLVAGNARQLSRVVVPHLDTAIPAATVLLLKSSKTEVLDLGWHGGLLDGKSPLLVTSDHGRRRSCVSAVLPLRGQRAQPPGGARRNCLSPAAVWQSRRLGLLPPSARRPSAGHTLDFGGRLGVMACKDWVAPGSR